MEFDLSMLNTQQLPEVKFDKKKIASKIVSQLASRAVSGVVVTMIHTNTRTYTTTQKVQLYIGAYVIGSMVADRAADYVEAKAYDTITNVVNFLWIEDESEAPESPSDLEVLIQAIPKQQ